MSAPRVTTVVIGAGPAGLLFAALAHILLARAAEKGTWALRVYDKRASYVRTHRLRIARAAYLQVQRKVRDPRFDGLVRFLTEHDFAPEVNALEQRLLDLLAEVGGTREVLAIGDREGETSLSELRARLAADGLLGPETRLTIVAADSVHSSIREAVRGRVMPERHTHEQLARIRVVGPELPRKLGAVSQARLSRVLGSIVDYRLNRNGFAEVDLFLSPPEFAAVSQLHASPKEPVALTSRKLDRLRAPLFSEIAAYLERTEAGQPREILLQSTFRLEHAVMPTLTFDSSELGATVFLVGDAGISLPFQRGMSCLLSCAHSLAVVHAALAVTGPAGQPEIMARYDAEAAIIKEREIRIVRNRARLVRTLREIVRLSAILPFPIQSWWLRAPGKRKVGHHLSLWFFVNLAVALAVVVLSLTWLRSVGQGRTDLARLAFSSLPVQFFGGVVYVAALAFEGRRRRLVRLIWELQLSGLFLAGLGVWLERLRATHHVRLGITPFWSLVLAAAFVLGVYAFERFVARWFSWAGLSFEERHDSVDDPES
jgi:2-polyprenyl-6-methoxyphenol hydroxylase-like FAD-dependent oxidoreductase